MTPREVLRILIAGTAVKRGGPFRLASGGESDVVVDLSLALRSLAAIDLLSKAISDLLPEGIVAVGGPGLGADPVAVACMLARPGLRWFTVRAAAKTHGFDVGKVTGPISPGDRVLLVEDVVTTGRSLCDAARAVRGSRLVGAIAVVDRSEDAFKQRWAKEFQASFHALFSLSEILDG